MIQYHPLPPTPIFFATCLSKETFEEELRRIKCAASPPFTNGTPATAHFFDCANGDIHVLVCFDVDAMADLTGIETAALMAHEAVHVMQQCRDWMREKDPGQEWEAFTVQHVVLRFMEDWESQA